MSRVSEIDLPSKRQVDSHPLSESGSHGTRIEARYEKEDGTTGQFNKSRFRNWGSSPGSSEPFRAPR